MPSRGSRPKTPRSAIDPGYSFRVSDSDLSKRADDSDDYRALTPPVSTSGGIPARIHRARIAARAGEIDAALGALEVGTSKDRDRILRALLEEASAALRRAESLDRREAAIRRQAGVVRRKARERKSALTTKADELAKREDALTAKESAISATERALERDTATLADRMAQELPTEALVREQAAVAANAQTLKDASARLREEYAALAESQRQFQRARLALGEDLLAAVSRLKELQEMSHTLGLVKRSDVQRLASQVMEPLRRVAARLASGGDHPD